MKMFTKIALVSAMAMSSSAFAMQAMTESDMSATTGQDGITVKITPPTGGLTIDSVMIHDKDGMDDPSTTTDEGVTAGAIVLGKVAGAGNGIKVVGGATTVKIDADGGTGSSSPILNINVKVDGATISTGDISVAASAREGIAVGTTGNGSVRGLLNPSSAVKVLDTMDLGVNGVAMNIQLGSTAASTAFIKLNGTLTGGLSISKLKVNDTSGTAPDATGLGGTKGGSLGIGKITVADTGGTDLTLNTDVNINREGLVLSMTGTTGTDIMLEDVRVGSSLTADNTLTFNDGVASNQTIGDIEISGIHATGSSITISGH